MKKEIWKMIPGYEGLYMVSNLGRVYSIRNKKYLKQTLVGNGYKSVVLSKNGVPKGFLVHRLVAMAFIPNPNNLPEVNHKDENPANNCVDNLEWCTKQYNLEYGTGRKRRAETLKGGKGCKKIVQLSLDKEFIRLWNSGKEIELEKGYKQAGISAVCNGKQYRHTAYGSIWMWYEDYISEYKEPQGI